MCFSATSSFAASLVIGTIGVATLRHVREPRALLFASVPMLFSLHQFCEGMVWLGLDGRIGKIGLDHVAFLFTLYAQGLLPLLMPAAVALMEPRGWRRRMAYSRSSSRSSLRSDPARWGGHTKSGRWPGS